MSDPNVAMAWCAIMLSNHLLHYRDILFSDEGAVVVVKSAKSLQYLERSLDKPLSLLGSLPFCVVSLLKDHFKGCPGPMHGPLFYKRCGV